MPKDKLTSILAFVWFAITAGMLMVFGLSLAGLLDAHTTDLDLTVLFAASVGGTITAWLRYGR
jgi:hypothetical protein